MSAHTDSSRFDEFCDQMLRALPRVRSFALAYCGSISDADDLLQLTCERALTRWRQWTADGPLERWLIKIFVNSFRDERRARSARSRLEAALADGLVNDCSNPESALYLDQVHAKIMRLPEGQRAVLLLVAGEGFSYQEAAELLGIPIGTVMSRLARARSSLISLVQHQVA